MTTAAFPSRRARVLRWLRPTRTGKQAGPPRGCRPPGSKVAKSVTKRYLLATFAQRVGRHRRPASATASKEVVTGR